MFVCKHTHTSQHSYIHNEHTWHSVWVPKHHSPLKEQKVLGEMVESRAQSVKAQDECGTALCARK